MMPTPRFIISMSNEARNTELIKGNVCYIDVTPCCSDGSDYRHPDPKLIRYYNNNTRGITTQDLIDYMTEREIEQYCQHCYLEGFNKVQDPYLTCPDCSVWKPQYGS